MSVDALLFCLGRGVAADDEVADLKLELIGAERIGVGSLDGLGRHISSVVERLAPRLGCLNSAHGRVADPVDVAIRLRLVVSADQRRSAFRFEYEATLVAMPTDTDPVKSTGSQADVHGALADSMLLMTVGAVATIVVVVVLEVVGVVVVVVAASAGHAVNPSSPIAPRNVAASAARTCSVLRKARWNMRPTS